MNTIISDWKGECIDYLDGIDGNYGALIDVKNNNAKLCRDECLAKSKDYKFIGLRVETCYCMKESPASDKQVPNFLCNFNCKGNRNEMCGGVDGDDRRVTVHQLVSIGRHTQL